MQIKIIDQRIDNELDVVLSHKRAIQLCELAGMSLSDKTRFATAVSEICRNTIEHADGGKITFYFVANSKNRFKATIEDTGEGIKDVENYLSEHDSIQFKVKGYGIKCARKLVDAFDVETSKKGTKIELSKKIPQKNITINEQIIQGWREQLQKDKAISPYAELKRRNEELVELSDLLKEKNTEGQRQLKLIQTLNNELEKANTELQQKEIVLEQRVKSRTKELSKAVKQLQESNNELEQYAYVASHDLQEPLRKIITFSDKIGRGYKSLLDAKGLDYLNRMQNAASRMQILIDNLLLFSRITTSKERFIPVDLNRLIHKIISDLEFENIKIETELPTVEMMSTQAQQLFQNIIGNAVKYSSKKENPEIIISSEIVSADSLPYFKEKDKNQKCALLRIQDNGVGFDDKYMDKIFVIFQRLHDSGNFPGTGMGLAIAKKIVENHKGTITASGKVGQGACFQIILPITQKKSMVGKQTEEASAEN